MRNIFTANRVAAISTWAAALAALVTGVTQTLPAGWQNGALIGAGLLTKLVVAVKFLDGSQKFDELVAVSARPSLWPAQTSSGTAPNQSAITVSPTTPAADPEQGPPADQPAVPEHLDPQQWLENRALPVPEAAPEPEPKAKP